ncbi:MAG: flagellar protein FlaG [Gammaproteobacteria bacterium]|nr:flagellar protein FlaG [Gammaproteobacteria bacterium]
MNVTATPSPDAATPTKPQTAEAGRPVPDGGRELPATGKAAPRASHAAPQISIDKALAQIQAYLADSKRQLDFQFDEASGRTIIRVVNPATGEVIRQIPAEEVLKLAAHLENLGLHTLDARA